MTEAIADLVFGLGAGYRGDGDAWLDTHFTELSDDAGRIAALLADLGLPAQRADRAGLNELSGDQAARCGLSSMDGRLRAVAVTVRHSEPPASVPEAYLKLHSLSCRLVRPHGTDLSGIFELLPNVVWTNLGPVEPRHFAERQRQARMAGAPLHTLSVDKFPRMADYVMPPGIRVGDAARVRLGAWLGPGATVMHEGFVNFNAGCAGPNMIEGRVSAGVFVGAHSDLGGGCSTMGTLSGGGGEVIRIGERCLIGANAGVGISLGDGCTVEAGLYLTAGALVSELGADGRAVRQRKARELSGAPDLLYRRHSQSGAIQCLPNRRGAELNATLHAHN